MMDKDTVIENGPVYVCFDFETSGRDPKNSRVIEIGACKIQNGMIIEEFSELIDPGFYISMIITQITGITNNDLKGCRNESDVFTDFLAFIADADCLMAHNLPFDARFLKETCKRLNVPLFDKQGICTLALSRKRVQSSRHTLGDLCLHFGILLDNAHRAIYDVRATVKLFEDYLKEEGDFKQASELATFCKN